VNETVFPVQADLFDDESKAKLKLWLRLLRATNKVSQVLRQRVRREYHTTMPRFDVMAALARSPDGLKMSELSRLLMVSNGNVTGVVDRLVEDGLLARGHSPHDRRASVVRLTETGRAAFGQMAAEHEEWVDELFASLDRETIDDLTRHLDRLNASLREVDA